jgi:hypothetical protein
VLPKSPKGLAVGPDRGMGSGSAARRDTCSSACTMYRKAELSLHTETLPWLKRIFVRLPFPPLRLKLPYGKGIADRGVGSGESECSVCARGESRSDESVCAVCGQWGCPVQFEFRFLHLAVILIGARLLRRSTNGHSQLTHSQRRDARTQSHPYHSHHTPHKSTASHAAQRPTALCVGGPAPRRAGCTVRANESIWIPAGRLEEGPAVDNASAAAVVIQHDK